MFKVFKFLMDRLLALVALIIFSPVFLICIIIIKIDSKGPIFFKQRRIGKNGKHFNILKFRTMRTDTPSNTPTHLLSNPDQWITKSGKVFRKTSLDELPQLINIFKGDMSIIGPRPALWNQYDLYELREKYNVNSVYPGLTGYAQIKGRDSISIEEKAKLDKYYIEKFSLWLDIKIFFMTFISVLKSDGIVEGDNSKKSKEESEE